MQEQTMQEKTTQKKAARWQTTQEQTMQEKTMQVKAMQEKTAQRKRPRKKGCVTEDYARGANPGVKERQRALNKERTSPPLSFTLTVTRATRPIPPLWAEAYRYFALYHRTLNLSLLFICVLFYITLAAP